MKTLIFLTTAGCHLCDRAREVIAQSSVQPLRLQAIDIACDDQLIERYGLRIPVLRSASGEELDWPFSAEDVQALMR
ncbi:glutaredoxin family protein [Gilvimarinus agarilyticus]|uniref:glutaredoxin family protein n=1 Tax=unclassified Gilvimarinus TaxID=2642066 RepID=UPI001C09233C|nr:MULTISPECIES: glutaredoxin family protein [unclassified Gilvimarinus]MBU2885120.1 glutaredoxin family protein [Gilvimarinus agarilyticus]MDO6570018.1 glutaredoxin family protein [Gilvimarinus sp. 2_MG-2023]MDO6747285.1 glutaredoxin family protein [Gilvimarinus sp. 1_MG-2023]